MPKANNPISLGAVYCWHSRLKSTKAVLLSQTTVSRTPAIPNQPPKTPGRHSWLLLLRFSGLSFQRYGTYISSIHITDLFYLASRFDPSLINKGMVLPELFALATLSRDELRWLFLVAAWAPSLAGVRPSVRNKSTSCLSENRGKIILVRR